uniref:ABC-type xenobiotic transporter n=1 Tax=Strigamia maritima TaxID=126957 RepID=T1JAN3_STRMM
MHMGLYLHIISPWDSREVRHHPDGMLFCKPMRPTMNPPIWFWKDLCNEQLNATTIWDPDTNTLNDCFESLVVKCPVYTIFAIISAYYAGYKKKRVKRKPPFTHLLTIRFIITFLILLCPIINFTLKKIHHQTTFSLVTYITFAVTISSWTIHLIYMVILRKGVTIDCRGPWVMILAWFFTWIVAAFDIMDVVKKSLSTADPEQVFLFASCILQVCYLATLVPKGMGEVVDYCPLLTVNIDEEEVEGFLESFRQGETPVWSDLGVAMHGTSLLNRLTFRWVLPMMDKGAKLLLQMPEHLFELPHGVRTSFVHTKFWILYKDFELRRGINRVLIDAESDNLTAARVVRKPVSLLRVLLSCFGSEYFLLAIPKFLSDSLTFCSPLLLNAVVSYKQDNTELRWHGYAYVGAMFGTTLMIAFLSTQFQFWMNNLALKIRAVIVTAIYRKCLATNVSNMMKLNTGEIVNYMSTDTDRIMNFCPSFHQFWSLPLQIAVCIVLLYLQVGLACLTGIGFVVILIPINKWLANKIGKLSVSMMAQKDQRVKLMNEILCGMLTIKFFGWEKNFSERISEYRNAELGSLKVFTCLTLVNMLIMPLNAFPWVLNGLVEAWVSLRRIENLLQLPETNLDDYYSPGSGNAKLLMNADFDWNCESQTSSALNSSLHSLNFNLKQGQLIGIIGTVGSGKTSLLHAILAEMKKSRGIIELKEINEGFGYVPQEAWIQQGTIQSNILLGKRYEDSKYQEVLEACSLTEDLSIMPNGDETQVGDRGMTLSGGQKARISLARACYQDKQFYLLDDPLSAMDAHVAKHIFNKCIRQLLLGKTVVLCTHQVSYLQDADWIIVMKTGTILKQGPPSEILPSLPSSFIHLSSNDTSSTKPLNSDLSIMKELSAEEESILFPEDLIAEEEREIGTVKFQVYTAYVKAIGGFLAIVIFISMLCMQGTRNASDLWLAYWTAHGNESTLNTTILIRDPLSDWDWDFNKLFSIAREMPNINFYLKIYAIIVGCNSIFTLFRAFLFAYGGIQAATNIHKRLIHQLFQAPTSFFEKNPVGRILNRFSSDLYAIDDSLPFILNIFLAQFFGLIGTIIVTCYSLPWILLLVIPLIAVYLNIQNYYRHTSREIKRLSAVTLSPIYSHFSETLSGLTSIRAFRVETKFRKENEEYLERSQRVLFSSQAAGQWLSFCLQLIGVVLVTGVTLLVIVTPVSISLAGLAISYGLTITGYLGGVVTSFTETEKEMVNAERALEYINGIDTEKWKGTLNVPPDWPSHGCITFSRVYLQYREHLPYSLFGVSFRIEPGEKIGIVGRTGAGKSSLLKVLFRLVEIKKGEILIDDVNIQFVDLKKLRSSMAIIPQDPFLFSGTVKQNIDPEDVHTDAELLQALEQCHLGEIIQNLGGLRGNLILCIDEATASVDFETDALIHQTICQIFHDRTVLTIAHRIETIMYCDRILVMSNAQIEEFDSPNKLLANPESMFYKLANKL